MSKSASSNTDDFKQTMATSFDPCAPSSRNVADANVPALLLRAVDLGLMSVVFVAPLFMGGRHAVGAFVYVTLVYATAFAWGCRQCLLGDRSWVRSAADIWFVLGTLLIVMQLLPLPWWLLKQISPAIADILPFWSGDADPALRLGTWSQVSLVPAATLGSLAMFVAHALLFVVVLQRVRSLKDVQWLLRCLAMAVVAMAVLGLLQLLLGNGKFLWVYEHPFRDTHHAAKGPFSNANHFAHFLALGIPAVVWLIAQRRSDDARAKHSTGRRGGFASRSWGRRSISAWDRHGRLALVMLLGIVVFGGLLSFSRGGVVVIAAAILIAGAMYYRQGWLSRREVAGLALVGAVVAIATVIYGYEPLANELATLGAGTVEGVDYNGVRRDLWLADLKVFARFPFLGTGGGTHVDVYPLYFDRYTDGRYTHAESGYVQVLLEFGLAGATLLVVAIGTCGSWCVRGLMQSKSRSVSACLSAVCAGLAASLIHSIWDFVWYIPACMSLTVVLAACANRLCHLASEGETCLDLRPAPSAASFASARRVGWTLATSVLAAAGTALACEQFGEAQAAVHWDAYARLTRLADEDPATAQNASTISAMIGHLENTLAANPSDARAHLRLATASLMHFDISQANAVNAMPLVHVRDTVLASQFPTGEARDRWLAAAIGENRKFLDSARLHAYRALQHCPLQGEAYLFLAQLSFLGGKTAIPPESYTKQALRLRPRSATVLLSAGMEAAQAGDRERTIIFLRQAFHQDPKLQSRIIEILGPFTGAADFMASFQPDRHGMGRLFEYYKSNHLADQAHVVAGPYVEKLKADASHKTGKAAARLWYQAYRVHSILGEPQAQLACLDKAVTCSPQDYDLRYALATELLMQQRFEEAVEQIRWCVSRKPQNKALRDLLVKSRQRQLEHDSGGLQSPGDARPSPPAFYTSSTVGRDETQSTITNR